MNQMVFYGQTMTEATEKAYSWLDAFAEGWRETFEGGVYKFQIHSKFIARWKPKHSSQDLPKMWP